MRCKACNSEMSDEDAIRKYPPDENGRREYSDLCGSCFETAVEVLYDTYEEPVSYGEFFSPCSMSRMPEEWE